MTRFVMSAHNVHTSGPFVETTSLQTAVAAFRLAVTAGYRNVTLRLDSEQPEYRG